MIYNLALFSEFNNVSIQLRFPKFLCFPLFATRELMNVDNFYNKGAADGNSPSRRRESVLLLIHSKFVTNPFVFKARGNKA